MKPQRNTSQTNPSDRPALTTALQNTTRTSQVTANIFHATAHCLKMLAATLPATTATLQIIPTCLNLTTATFQMTTACLHLIMASPQLDSTCLLLGTASLLLMVAWLNQDLDAIHQLAESFQTTAASLHFSRNGFPMTATIFWQRRKGSLAKANAFQTAVERFPIPMAVQTCPC
jgi:hypothetical protein